jgi:hypothetical protein
MKTIKIKQIAYHRNGVAGEGFHVILFTSKEIPCNQTKTRNCNFIATVFNGIGQVTVIDIDVAAAGCVEFGLNSWRGDDFEAALRDAIGKWEIERDAEITKQILERK